MGAVNYGSGNIINIGYREEDEYNYYDTQDIFDAIYRNIPKTTHYKIELKSGYYGGFYLMLTHDTMWLCLEEERKEMVAEIMEIYDFLKGLILSYDNLYVYGECGWCGCSWLTKSNSLKEIKEKIENEFNFIHNIPTIDKFNSSAELVAYVNNFH